MASSIGHYLDSFKASLGLDLAIAEGVARELRAHFEDRRRELKESGLSEDEANRIAVESLGAPELVAHEVYDTHAQGTWQAAVCAGLPHLLFALLFASYHWQNVFCLATILTATVGLAVHGWQRGRPVWLFPWLGYYLIPVIAAGILLVHLPQGWGWIAALVYAPMALFVIFHLVTQSARRDWLYASLMLAPMPVFSSWLVRLGNGNALPADSAWLATVQAEVPWIVVSFVVLAVATVSFVRAKPRWHKVLSVFIPPVVISIAVVVTGPGCVDYWGSLMLLLPVLAFTAPFWLQSRIEFAHS